MLEKVQHIGILVKDMDEALQFYMEKLKLPLRERRTLPNKVEIAFLPVGDTEIELVAPPEPPAKEGLDHLAFLVKDLREVLRVLAESGLRVPEGTTIDPDKPATVFIPGPTGFTLELIKQF